MLTTQPPVQPMTAPLPPGQRHPRSTFQVRQPAMVAFSIGMQQACSSRQCGTVTPTTIKD